jgi:hypothetical protein
MHQSRPLTFETLLRDPLVRSVMRSDGVSVADMVAVLGAARAGLVARERQAARVALAEPAAEALRRPGQSRNTAA